MAVSRPCLQMTHKLSPAISCAGFDRLVKEGLMKEGLMKEKLKERLAKYRLAMNNGEGYDVKGNGVFSDRC